MRIFDLMNEAFDVDFGQYIVRDLARPDRSWSADTKKDVIDAIMANAIKKWQVIEADSEDILADYHHDSILNGKITPKDKTFNRIQELMFSVEDDTPDHAPFPKVQVDMEVVDPALDSE
jgi:hypothetical protein